jgi:hypothetical protein
MDPTFLAGDEPARQIFGRQIILRVQPYPLVVV